jgi:asparagine synthase (glutamine-hydrolysing)
MKMLDPFPAAAKIGKGRDQIIKTILNSVKQANPLDAYLSLFPNYSNEIFPSFLNKEFKSKLEKDLNEQEYVSKYFEVNDLDHIEKLIYFDIKTSLVDEMLAKVDKMTMAHGLEARVPFLDHKLVEFAFSINENLKIKKFKNKYTLKKAFSEIVPNKVLYAPKRGFNLPIDEWLRNELRPELEDLLSKKRLKEIGIFNINNIFIMKQKHLAQKENIGLQLWGIMVLVKWFFTYL